MVKKYTNEKNWSQEIEMWKTKAPTKLRCTRTQKDKAEIKVFHENAIKVMRSKILVLTEMYKEYTGNMKALFLIVQMYYAIFLNVTLAGQDNKVKHLLWTEKSCYKECT